MPEATLTLAPTAALVLALASQAVPLVLQGPQVQLQLTGEGSSTIELEPGPALVLAGPVGSVSIEETQEVALELFPILRGPQGVAGGDGVVQRTAIAGAALGGHRAVYLAAGEAHYASAADAASAHACIGITTGAAIEGDNVVITTLGRMVEGSWAWTPGLPVYLALNGLLTQTVPTTDTLLEVGIATAATELEVRIRPPITLI
jgi:hypothetical protein